MTLPIEPILDRYEVDYNPAVGRNQQVKCPFHDDTHASASVHLDKGLFMCFTCEAGGDAISLLMREEGLEFGEAKRIAEELAREAGAEVSRESDSKGSLLPRNKGSRPGRRAWRTPWARGRS